METLCIILLFVIAPLVLGAAFLVYLFADGGDDPDYWL